jgi:CheY-like chemotaxis protein
MERVSRGLGLLAQGSDGRDLAAELHTLGGEAAMVRLPVVARMAWEGEDAARQLGVGRDAYAACDHILHDLGNLLRELSDPAPVVEKKRGVPSSGRGRILVVDDSRIATQVLSESFESHGFDVRSATTLVAAEEMFRLFVPEILVADVNMPGLDVADLCQRFRACTSGGKHVVLVSGHSEAELRARLAQIQPDAFVCKTEGADVVAARVAALASGD